MIRWLARRLLQAAATWAVAVTALFCLVRLLPGDPLASAGDLTPDAHAALARLYGLDQPLPSQLSHFVSGLLHGDLGISTSFGRPVTELLGDHLGITLLLGGAVLLTDLLVALGLGTWLAARARGAADRWTSRLLLTGHALPPFWLGLVLVWLFALTLHWFPAAGATDPLLPGDASLLARAGDLLRHLALPWLTLTLTTLVVPLRHHREAVLETLDSDWVRAARARGVSEGRVLRQHAARTALAPLIVLLGLWLPMLLTGAVLVETTFAWPGLGWLMAEAVGSRDFPLATGCILLGAGAVVVGSVLADLLQRLVDPRTAT